MMVHVVPGNVRSGDCGNSGVEAQRVTSIEGQTNVEFLIIEGPLEIMLRHGTETNRQRRQSP